jgi:RNA polymerase sigma-70 factor, ECF subfamily
MTPGKLLGLLPLPGDREFRKKGRTVHWGPGGINHTLTAVTTLTPEGSPVRTARTPPLVAPGTRRATEEAGSPVAPAEASLSRRIVLPHLDAAYNLARWLTRDPDDARDAVEEAVYRAFGPLASRKGGDARPWFLAIVRDAVLAPHGRERPAESIPLGAPDREDGEPPVETVASPAGGLEPPRRLEGEGVIDGRLRRLPPEFREVLMLRELEGLSYKEIAAVAGIPIGTVISRLARARQLMLAQGREPAPGSAAEAREDGAPSPRRSRE